MRAASAVGFSVLAFVVLVGFAGATLAEDAGTPPAVQQESPGPPAAPAPSGPQQNPLPAAPAVAQPAPAPDASTDPQSCLAETGDYVTRDKAVDYLIGITNNCDRRLRCEIFANVTGAKGSSLGHTIMILGAKSSGAAATKTYTMRVKAAGGTAQVSRDCKVL